MSNSGAVYTTTTGGVAQAGGGNGLSIGVSSGTFHSVMLPSSYRLTLAADVLKVLLTVRPAQVMSHDDLVTEAYQYADALIRKQNG